MPDDILHAGRSRYAVEIAGPAHAIEREVARSAYIGKVECMRFTKPFGEAQFRELERLWA
jgi:hypothetical protein